MTADRRVFLFCNGTDDRGNPCDATADYSTVPDARTADEARQFGRSLEWHVGLPGGRDLCPGCWNRGQR